MFFGLMNSPATFQTMMNAIFAEELRENWLTIYMDDILVHTSDNITAHREKVHKVLQKLRQHDLYLKLEKCQFEQKKSRIPRRHTRKRDSTDGPNENQRNRGLEDTTKPQRRPHVPRLHRILQILRPQLLKNRKTTDRTHKESSTISLGRSTMQSVRDTQIPDVQPPSTQTTRLHQTILPIN